MPQPLRIHVFNNRPTLQYFNNSLYCNVRSINSISRRYNMMGNNLISSPASHKRLVFCDANASGDSEPFKAQCLLYVPPGLTFDSSTFCVLCCNAKVPFKAQCQLKTNTVDGNSELRITGCYKQDCKCPKSVQFARWFSGHVHRCTYHNKMCALSISAVTLRQ